MKNPDAFYETQQVDDSIFRDNFQKLNRLFYQGDFTVLRGTFKSQVANLSNTTGTGINKVASFAYERLGNLVVLHMLTDLTATAKQGTANPMLTTLLPTVVLPRTGLHAAIRVNSEMGAIRLTAEGSISFTRANFGNWTNGAAASVATFAISYLGA